MLFYYRSSQENHGPFEIDQLKNKITFDTYVWSVGMKEWELAKNVEALAHLFDLSNAPSQKEDSAPFFDRSSNILDDSHIEKSRQQDDQKKSQNSFNENKLIKESSKNTSTTKLKNHDIGSELINSTEKVKDTEIDHSFLNQVETELKKMIPWAKFYGIFQIITTILFLFSIFGQWNNSKKLGEAFATLLVLAMFSFIPGIIILNISSSSKKFSQSKSSKDLFETIKTTSSYFRYIGVCLLIVLILGVIVTTIALA